MFPLQRVSFQGTRLPYRGEPRPVVKQYPGGEEQHLRLHNRGGEGLRPQRTAAGQPGPQQPRKLCEPVRMQRHPCPHPAQPPRHKIQRRGDDELLELPLLSTLPFPQRRAP
eukprot:gene2639-biopygen12956